MLIPRPALAELEAALRAPGGGLRAAAVDLDLDPLEMVRSGAESFGSAVFFAGPGGQAVGGLGVAWSAKGAGPGRFESLDEALRGAVPQGVAAVLGFAFTPGGPHSPEWDGFPAAAAVIPQIAVWRKDGSSRLCVAVPAGGSPAGVLAAAGMLRRPGPAKVPLSVGPPRPVPPVAEWVGRVNQTVAAIHSGGPGKVVLARAQRVALGRRAAPFDVVAVLRGRNPGCYAYGWQEGPAALVGASPELLVARTGERFAARPLAGSAPRGAGPEEDRRLGDRLLADPKERAEHAFVAEEVASRLALLAETMDSPAGPGLQRLAGVQHLATTIGGTTRARLLALVGALHPTAAVAGVPRAEALAYIDRVERMDRGWYAGGLGWAEPGGDGEVAVALRCALLRGEEALVYAGAGIVADSDAEAEAAETELKMGPLLGVFGA